MYTCSGDFDINVWSFVPYATESGFEGHCIEFWNCRIPDNTTCPWKKPRHNWISAFQILAFGLMRRWSGPAPNSIIDGILLSFQFKSNQSNMKRVYINLTWDYFRNAYFQCFISFAWFETSKLHVQRLKRTSLIFIDWRRSSKEDTISVSLNQDWSGKGRFLVDPIIYIRAEMKCCDFCYK